MVGVVFLHVIIGYPQTFMSLHLPHSRRPHLTIAPSSHTFACLIAQTKKKLCVENRCDYTV